MFGRLGHFVKDMGGAVENVAKVGAFVANPVNAPKIASGALKAGEFVAEHPGQTAHIAKEVGIHMAKEQLKPQNLLLTGGLLAATVLTGGAAAPALAGAEAGMVGAEGGLAAAEGIEAGISGAKAIEAGTQGAKAVEAAADAGQAARSTEEAVNVGRAAEDAVQAGKTGSRFTRGIEKVNDVRRSVSPIAQRTSAFRTGLGEQVLAGAPEGAEAGPVRQALANLVQGQGGVGAPARMAGQSDSAYRMQQGVHYARTARSTLNNIKAAPEVASAVADPEGYAMKKALGGVKMGDTGEDYQTDPYGRTITGDSVNNGDVSANGIVQPRAFKGLLSENTVLRGGAKMQNFGVGVAANNSLGGPNAFWKGPGREAFGGVPKGYDWRNIQQRPVGMVARSDAFMQGHSLPSLEQPPSADASATADKPVSPPTLPSQAVAAPTPAKMVTSAMYSGGTQSNTVGARIMPSAGGNSRGGKSDHSTFYGSGTTYGEDVDFTMTGTPGWNGKDAGTMTFTKPLVQPAKPAEPLMEEPAAEAVQQKPKFTNTHGRGPGR